MDLNFHHIGGRWGTVPPLEPWKGLFGLINLTLYEPDERSCQQIERLDLKRTNGYRTVSLVPLCIGSHDGESDLHLCFDRNASSMHPFDQSFSDWNFFTKKHERGLYKFGIANAAAQKVRVACRALDSLRREDRISQPDLLSIDAEGASMDILKGATEVLDGTLGVFIEGSVIPTHHGEASFSDLLAFLRARSFLLVSIGSSARVSITETPIGVYDRGIVHAFEDSVLIKDPHAVEDRQSLMKLSLIALLSGNTSVAHVCFQKLDAMNVDFTTLGPEAAVLSEFHQAYSEIKDLLLPKINETYTEDIYNIGSYVVDVSEISRGTLKELHRHRRETLQKYVPILVKAVEFFRTHGGFYAPIYRKYGFEELAQHSASAEAEHVGYLSHMLKKSGLVILE